MARVFRRCAGPLWTAQNALCLSYPTPETKGRYFAVFWIVFNLGGVVGGVISFITNFSSSASTASGSTFLLFIMLMMGGSVLATTLVDPSLVKRPNGTPVAVSALPDWKDEAMATLKLFRNREMLLLTPLFAYTGWFYPYLLQAFICHQSPSVYPWFWVYLTFGEHIDKSSILRLILKRIPGSIYVIKIYFAPAFWCILMTDDFVARHQVPVWCVQRGAL